MLLSVWVVLYAVSIFALLFGITKLRQENYTRERESIHSLTVIVPFRNEANHLKQFLDCANAQTIQPSKWIFVNDHSNDEFEDLFYGYDLPMELIHLDNEFGKKKAIRKALESIETAYFLTMDADVVFGVSHIEQVMNCGGADLVILPVEMTETKWWHSFFTVEYLFTTLINKGVTGWARPVNCSGANLLIHTNSFRELDDIETHEQILSGDDMYTLRAFRNAEKDVRIVEDAKMTVFTKTPKTLQATLKQRVRWAAKTGNVGDDLNTFLGFWAVGLHLLYFLVVLVLVAYSAFVLCLLTIVVKFILDGLLLFSTQITWKKVGGLMLFELFYPIYIFVLFFQMLFQEPEWKGR